MSRHCGVLFRSHGRMWTELKVRSENLWKTTPIPMDDYGWWSCFCLFKLYIIYIYTYTYIYIYEPGPRTPTPPPQMVSPPPPQNLVFACYLHIYIHIYTYILPFPPLQPRISTLFAALESHDLVNGPCLPVYFYHNLFFEPPIACLAHGLQHICYLWITQSLPMQT